MSSTLKKIISQKFFLGSFFVFTSLLISTPAHASVLSPGNISSCGEIAVGGTYTLSQNITGATSTCFIISSDGVTIDGGGFSVTASGTVPLAIDARSYRTPGDLSSGLLNGGNGYTNIIISNLTLNGFTTGINLSGNTDTNGLGANSGYGGPGGDVLVENSNLGSIYSNGGNTSTFGYGGSGGNITMMGINVDVSSSTLSVAPGTGTTGLGPAGGFFLTYSGIFTHTNLTLSALSFFTENSVSKGAYVGGKWPLTPGTITTCGTLLSSGTYTLANDIGSLSSPVASSSCFVLNSSNITIDGQGHYVYGTSTNTNFAVVAGSYASTTLANINFSGFPNLVSSTAGVIITGADVNLFNQLINAGTLNISYTSSVNFASSTIGNLSNLTVNGYNFGSITSGPILRWITRNYAGAWRMMASSVDGTKLAVLPQGGYIWTSKDSGATWTQQSGPGNRNWSAITSSADGTKIAATDYNGYMWISSNSGTSWTQVRNPNVNTNQLIGVNMSADGTRMAAFTNGNGYIYISTDMGINWATSTSAGQRTWTGVTFSADGKRVVAVAGGYLVNSYIYTSSDYGAHWTEQTGAGFHQFYAISSSADGKKLVAGIYDGAGSIWTSTDYGVTWTEHANLVGDASAFWWSISSSADGTRLSATTINNFGYLYTSNDSGATWTQRTELGATLRLMGNVISADGSKLIMASENSGGLIYTFFDPTRPVTGTIVLPYASSTVTSWNSIISWSNATTCQYSYDGFASTTNTISCSNYGSDILAPATPGNYTLSIRAIGANNITSIKSVSFSYSYNPIAITFPAKGVTIDPISWAPAITWDPTHAGNLTSCQYSYDNFVNQTYTANCSNNGSDILPPTSSGAQTLYVRTVDSNSNTVNANSAFTYAYYDLTKQTNSGQHSWYSVTSSADGTKLAAVDNNTGYIYISSDSGLTWATSTSSGKRQWWSIKSSASSTDSTVDGKYLVAAANAGYVYTSSDYGVSWATSSTSTINAAIRSWCSVTISSSGKYMAAAAQSGYVYTSSDYGVTWVQQSTPGSRSWISVTSSADGSKLIAVATGIYFGAVFTSSNYGSTWVQATGVNWGEQYYTYYVTYSGDGSKIYLLDANMAAAGFAAVSVSTTSATTWTQLATSSTAMYSMINATAITTSANGQVVAVSSPGGIYISRDFGVTWTALNSEVHNWKSVALSADGTKLAAVDNNTGYIYTSTIAINSVTVNIIRPVASSTVQSVSWSPIVNWGSSVTCQYSYNNFAITTTATCANGGSDILPPSAGTQTLYVRGSDGINGTTTKSVSFVYSPTLTNNVSSCGTISSPGTYTLTQDITGDLNVCFNVLASNVTIDGAGHTVTAGNGNNTYGVTAGIFSGLTLKNITFTGYGIGEVNSLADVNLFSTANLVLTNLITANSLSLNFSGVLTTVSSFFSNLISLTINTLNIGQFLAGQFSWSTNSISSCGATISSPGVYTLLNNLFYSGTSGSCLNINADQVIIDGAGHTITATNGSSGYAITATSTIVTSGGNTYSSGGNGHVNVGIKNISFVGFAGGVYAKGADNTTATHFAGFNGGSVSLDTVTIASTTIAVDTSGGSGFDPANAGNISSGGNAGNILISNSPSLLGSVFGKGGNGYFSSTTPGAGGNGGSIIISTSTVGNVSSNGGDAAGGVGATTTANGGTSGLVTFINATSTGTVTHNTESSIVFGCNDPGAANYIAGLQAGQINNALCQYYGLNLNNPVGNIISAPVVSTTTILINGVGVANLVGTSTIFTNNWVNYGTVVGTTTFLTSMGGNAAGAIVNGNATFGSTINPLNVFVQNYGTVNGNVNFYFGNNYGVVNGNAIFFGDVTSSYSTYGFGNRGTINGNAQFRVATDPRGTVTGNVTFYYGCTNPNASNYDSRVLHDNGSCVNYGSTLDLPAGKTVTGPITFSANHSNYGTVTGDATFNTGSYNYGTVTGNATFKNITSDASGNVTISTGTNYLGVGNVGGNIIDSTGTTTTNFDFYGTSYNSGTVSPKATYHDMSSNRGIVSGNAKFMTTYYDTTAPTGGIFSLSGNANWNGKVTGVVTGIDNQPITQYVFNGTSYNTGTVNANAKFNTTYYDMNLPASSTFIISGSSVWNGTVAGNITGSDNLPITNYVFNGTSHNDITVNGSVTYNGSAYNNSTVNGNVIFEETGPFKMGIVNGTSTLAGTNQTIQGNNTVSNLIKYTSIREVLYLTSGATTTASSSLIMHGVDANNLLTVRSTVPGSPAGLNILGTADLNYVRLKDIQNNGPIIDLRGRYVYDDGGNSGFIFNANIPVGQTNLTYISRPAVYVPPPAPSISATQSVHVNSQTGGGGTPDYAYIQAKNPGALNLKPLPIVGDIAAHGGLGQTVLGNPLEGLKSPGNITLVLPIFSLVQNISTYLFAPLPSTISEALKGAIGLTNYLASVGLSREQDLVSINRKPIQLTKPEKETPGLFIVTNARSETLNTYVSRDASSSILELVKTGPNTDLTISLVPLSKDKVITAKFLNQKITFTYSKKPMIYVNITTPIEPGRYLLTTPASPIPLAIDVLAPVTQTPQKETPPTQTPKKSNWFNWIVNMFH